VLEESTIDLILGMSWLRKKRQFIHCAKGTIELTSSKGERFEVEIVVTTTTRLATFLVDEKFIGGNIRADWGFSGCLPRGVTRDATRYGS
jgi:hypothetical protein